jgi:hypothetical protein
MKKRKSKTKDKTEIKDKREINRQLAAEIKEFLPHVTDEVHMKAALALDCEYKVIKAYLAGNIEDESVARQLIKNLQTIIVRGYDSFGDQVEAQDAGYQFCHVAESVLNTFKLCNTANIMLEQIESRLVHIREKLTEGLNDFNRKLDLLAAKI